MSPKQDSKSKMQGEPRRSGGSIPKVGGEIIGGEPFVGNDVEAIFASAATVYEPWRAESRFSTANGERLAATIACHVQDAKAAGPVRGLRGPRF